MFEYKEPEKPQIFREIWSVKDPRGLVHKADIIHAIGNSDQYPWPLWSLVDGHKAEQETQEQTLCAVIAALERIPVYEDKLDPDAISRDALMNYLSGKLAMYGEDYGTAEMLLDIREFNIKRKEIE